MNIPTEIPVSGNARQVAGWIWRNLVPKSGQCGTVQGELIRTIEKLSWEARNNGNANWDSGFEILIAFLEHTICDEPQIAKKLKQSIGEDLCRLRDYQRPCTDEDIYVRLTAAAVEWCRIHPQLISKPVDPSLHR
jgi:hypothetical protein